MSNGEDSHDRMRIDPNAGIKQQTEAEGIKKAQKRHRDWQDSNVPAMAKAYIETSVKQKKEKSKKKKRKSLLRQLFGRSVEVTSTEEEQK